MPFNNPYRILEAHGTVADIALIVVYFVRPV